MLTIKKWNGSYTDAKFLIQNEKDELAVYSYPDEKSAKFSKNLKSEDYKDWKDFDDEKVKSIEDICF